MPSLTSAIGRATRLTRKGRLLEATSVIQKALGSGTAPPKSPTKGRAKPVAAAKQLAKPTSRSKAAPAPKALPERKRVTPPSPRTAPPSARATPRGFASGTSLPGAGSLARVAPSARARLKRSIAKPSIPDGARYPWRSHTGPHGARRYRLYVPGNLPAGPRPLLVMLHGCTQGADDFARGTRILEAAERHGVLVALPEQDRAANAMACWNWFEPAHQGRGAGEPAILAGIVRNVLARESVDPARVFVAGLSAGGAMAAVLGATEPEMFAGVGVHSGLPYRAASDMTSAMRAMRSGAGRVPAVGPRGAAPRLFVVHGTADGTVSPRNADRLLEAMGRGERQSERHGRVGVTRLVREGRTVAEDWRVAGLGHAWSGGEPGASYTAPDGPDATEGMLRFFLEG